MIFNCIVGFVSLLQTQIIKKGHGRTDEWTDEQNE